MMILAIIISIGMITCFLDCSFIVIFFFDLTRLDLLTMLLTLTTFLVGSFGKASLILIILSMLDFNVLVYNFFVMLSFLKNLDLAKVSFLGLKGIGEGVIKISVGLFVKG